jgi:hypothetical protein
MRNANKVLVENPEIKILFERRGHRSWDDIDRDFK